MGCKTRRRHTSVLGKGFGFSPKITSLIIEPYSYLEIPKYQVKRNHSADLHAAKYGNDRNKAMFFVFFFFSFFSFIFAPPFTAISSPHTTQNDSKISDPSCLVNIPAESLQDTVISADMILNSDKEGPTTMRPSSMSSANISLCDPLYRKMSLRHPLILAHGPV